MIRPFDNLDAPALHRIWQAHYGELGLSPNVTQKHLERAILGRPWFDPQTLLVAVDDSRDTTVAWCHVASPHGVDNVGCQSTIHESSTHESGQATHESNGARILCLLAMPESNPSFLGELLKSAEERFGPITHWGNAMDHRHGYAGLDPIGWTIGIRPDHAAVNDLIAANGFRSRPESLSDMCLLAYGSFKMPVTRQFLAWRRSAQVQTAMATAGRSGGRRLRCLTSTETIWTD